MHLDSSITLWYKYKYIKLIIYIYLPATFSTYSGEVKSKLQIMKMLYVLCTYSISNNHNKKKSVFVIIQIKFNKTNGASSPEYEQ